MSSYRSKNKQKRTRSTSNETTPTSFVDNVASKVSSLLPTRISQWFNSSSTSNVNHPTPAAESEDSSTDDEVLENPPMPAKRMRMTTTEEFNNFEHVNISCTSTKVQITVKTGPSKQLPANRNSVFKPLNEYDTFDNKKKETNIPKHRNMHSFSSVNPSQANKRNVATQSNIGYGRIGPDDLLATARELYGFHGTPSVSGSTFYQGRTMYGGAVSQYINKPNINFNKRATAKYGKVDQNSGMSTSVRNVIDSWECYSSPLTEDKRYTCARRSYKTQELYLARQSSIMHLKRKSQLMDTVKLASQITATHSSSSNDPSNHQYDNVNVSSGPEKVNSDDTANTLDVDRAREETISETGNNSLKVLPNAIQGNELIQESNDIVTPLKLPAVVLKIDQNKLPKFTLDNDTPPPVSNSLATSTPKMLSMASKQCDPKKNIEIVKHLNTVSNNNIFIFSEPIKISCDVLDVTDTPLFVFDSAEQQIDKTIDSQIDSSAVDITKSSEKPKNWQCPDCWVNNKPETTKCVCCGCNNSKVKPAKCTICKLDDCLPEKDKCVHCEKVALKKPLENSTTWKCVNCWATNDDFIEKCMYCKSPMLTETDKAILGAEMAAFPKIPPLRHGGFVLDSANTWRKSSKDAESVVPLSTPSSIAPNDKNDSILMNIAKTQKSNKWECRTCLVMNDTIYSQCICCATERTTKSKLPAIKFCFGKASDIKFKFGIDPKLQGDKTETPEIKSTNDAKQKNHFTVSDNVLAEKPTPTFNFPSTEEGTKADNLKDVSSKTDSLKFTFGIPNVANISENQPETATAEDNEKLQEVPQLQINPQKPLQPMVPLIVAPLVTSDEKDKQEASAPIMFPISTNQNSEIPAKEDVPNKTPTTIDNAEPQIKLFTGPSLKIATNLFSLPSDTTAITTDSFKISTPIAPVTTTVTNILLMQTLSEPEKTEAVTSIAPSITKPLIAASLFTFGQNTTTTSATVPVTTSSNSLPITEPHGFQFTFGSNNTVNTEAGPSLLSGPNAQPVFNSPFGNIDETPKNTNSFAFNASNTLGSNNAIAPLGVTNALSTSSGLPSNEGANNAMGGNTLPGNILGNQNQPGNGIAGNMLTDNNTLSSNLFFTNNLPSGNNVTSASTLGGINGLPGNTLASGNSLQTGNPLNNNTSNITPNIFGNTVHKENMWNPTGNTPSNNLFASNSTTNSLQKPPAFSFGTSSPFNITAPSLSFGNNVPSGQNVFGMAPTQNNNQPSPFASPIQNQNPAPAPMFGSQQSANNPTPPMGLFGTQNILPNASTVPAFGAPNPSVPTFEQSSMASAPAPAFNFGAPVQSPVFGFGQQPVQQQPQQPIIYSFGGPPPPAPQVQFAMGTAPNPAGRRLRKAVRRTTPR